MAAIRLASSSTISGSKGGGGATILKGTTEERPQNPTIGDLFFNKTYDTLEQYTKSGWQKSGYQIATALRLNNLGLM